MRARSWIALAKSQDLAADFKKPTGCLLGACSGRHPVGYRLLTHPVVFRSHYSVETRARKKVSRVAIKFYGFSKYLQVRNLFRNRGRPRGHQFGKAGVTAQPGELGILIYVVDPFVALLHGAPEVLQRPVAITHLGAEFGDQDIVMGAVPGRRQLRRDSVVRGSF